MQQGPSKDNAMFMFTNKSTLERLGIARPERLIRLLLRPNFEKLLEARIQTPIFERGVDVPRSLLREKMYEINHWSAQHFYLPNNVCFLDFRWLIDDESVTDRYYRIVMRVLTHRLHLFDIQVSCSLWCFGAVPFFHRFVVLTSHEVLVCVRV